MTACKTAEVPVSRKLISDGELKEELFVTNKTPKTKEDKDYYWYKSQKVHKTRGAYGGDLLHGTYTKYYYSNQLAQKGDLLNGLKNGEWASWNEEGTIKSRVIWQKGILNGKAVLFDDQGNIIEKGNYKNNLKSGKWLYPIQKDTIFYKKGQIVVKEKDTTKVKFFKRIFKKKDDTADKGIEVEKSPKEGFFKRLFKKKDKKAKTQKQETKKVKEAKTELNFFQRLFRKKEEKQNIKTK